MPFIKDINGLKHINGYIPTKKQILLHKSKSRYNLFGGSMGCGKSAALVNELIYCCLKYDGAICLLCRKNLNSLKKTTVMTLQQWLPSKFLHRFNKNEMIFEFKNGSKILCFGLSDYEALQRIKGIECVIFGIDEASDIDDNGEAFRILTTRLRQDIEGAPLKGILTSNPCRISWIRKLFIDQKQRGYRFIPSLPKDNKYLKKSYISGLKKTLTEQEFEILALGKWEKAQPPSAMFEYDRVMAAVKRKGEIGKNVVYGIDPGLDESESVLIKRAGNKIEIVFAIKTKNLREVAEKVKKAIWNKGTLINCDGIGIGAGLIGLLEDRGFRNVVSINQSEQAENDNMFFNKRAENFYKAYEMLDSLNLQNDSVLIEEMLSLQKLYDPNGRLKIESKSALVKKGRSPSRLDALILSCIGIGKTEEDNESEITLSKSQLNQLEHNLLKLERVMSDVEKGKKITYIEKYEKDFIRQELVGKSWREYRREYDRLIIIYNRFTNKGWYKNSVWSLKSRSMEYEYDHIVRYKYSDEDNENIDIEIHIKGIEKIGGYPEKTIPNLGSNGGMLLTGEDIFGRGDLPPESGGEE